MVTACYLFVTYKKKERDKTMYCYDYELEMDYEKIIETYEETTRGDDYVDFLQG